MKLNIMKEGRDGGLGKLTGLCMNPYCKGKEKGKVEKREHMGSNLYSANNLVLVTKSFHFSNLSSVNKKSHYTKKFVLFSMIYLFCINPKENLNLPIQGNGNYHLRSE